MLSSRLVDYIKEMSDRALNCATLLLELQVPVLDELASLLNEWGVGVVVRPGMGAALVILGRSTQISNNFF